VSDEHEPEVGDGAAEHDLGADSVPPLRADDWADAVLVWNGMVTEVARARVDAGHATKTEPGRTNR
jgi:hypothetical protein